MHFATRVRRSRVDRLVDIHICLCGQQDPKLERAIRLVYLPSFCKLRSSSNPTKQNLEKLVWSFEQLHLGNNASFDTCPYELLFLTMADEITSQLLTFPPLSPCIKNEKFPATS